MAQPAEISLTIGPPPDIMLAAFADNDLGLLRSPENPAFWWRQFPNDAKAHVVDINWLCPELTAEETVRGLIRHHYKLNEFGIDLPATQHYLTTKHGRPILYSQVAHVEGIDLGELQDEEGTIDSSVYYGSLQVVGRGIQRYISWVRHTGQQYCLWDVDRLDQYLAPNPHAATMVDPEPFYATVRYSDTPSLMDDRVKAIQRSGVVLD